MNSKSIKKFAYLLWNVSYSVIVNALVQALTMFCEIFTVDTSLSYSIGGKTWNRIIYLKKYLLKLCTTAVSVHRFLKGFSTT